jgi:hypothetical protein
MPGLYPNIEPYELGRLHVGDGHQVYWETCGNPSGKAALMLHGGPGSGCSPGSRPAWRRRESGRGRVDKDLRGKKPKATDNQLRMNCGRRVYGHRCRSSGRITDMPYVTGGGPQQQLDLYIPTQQKNMPLVVFIHGGGWEHGDKFGDSLNPNNLQLLWDGY